VYITHSKINIKIIERGRNRYP